MHEYTSKARIWELTCPGFREEISRARRWTRDILDDTAYADDVALIITELVTNAVLHSASGNGSGAFHIHIARSPKTIVLSVADSGGTSTAPHVACPDEVTPHGRGLALVHALADKVRIHGDDHHGHTVTAELRLAPVETTEPPTRVTGLPAC